MIAIPLEPHLRLGRVGRDLLALAISVALVGLAVNAVVMITDTLQVAVVARETAAALVGDPRWFIGGGAPARGQWPWGSTILTVVLGGGLMVTGLYGARTAVIVLRGMFESERRGGEQA